VNAIQKNVLLAPYTTFKIGGPAKYFVETKSVEEIQEFCKWAQDKNIPIFVLGGGSNVLISDKGFDGLVLKIQNAKIKIQNDNSKSKIITAEAGVQLAKLVSETAKRGLSGLEWAVGIPGTVGGAIAGNASCFGGQMADVIEKVQVLDLNDLSIFDLKNFECDFGYHESVFKNSPGLIILGVHFILKTGVKDEILKNIQEVTKKRTKVQPIKEKSAGCFFKNLDWKRHDMDKARLLKKFPEFKQFSDKSKISVGFLIDYLGLKGRNIGDANVSNEHANFILNCGNATAEQMVMLTSLIKSRVNTRYGFNLEEEVNLIGF